MKKAFGFAVVCLSVLLCSVFFSYDFEKILDDAKNVAFSVTSSMQSASDSFSENAISSVSFKPDFDFAR